MSIHDFLPLKKQKETKIPEFSENIPENYKKALKYIFNYSFCEDRVFICLGWLDEELGNGDKPPLIFLISTEELSHAIDCSIIIKNLCETLMLDEKYKRISKEAFHDVLNLIHKRITILTMNNGKKILDEIGIITEYNGNSEMKVIPFNHYTGFDPNTANKFRELTVKSL